MIRPFDVLHITDTDLDGVGCAILSNIYYRNAGKSVNTICMNISEANKMLLSNLDDIEDGQYERILITDLSLNRDVMDFIDSRYEKTSVLFIDHHDSSLEYNDLYNWAIVKSMVDGIKISATKLFFDKYFTNTNHLAYQHIAEFVHYTDLYDTFNYEHDQFEKALEINTLRYMMSFEEFKEKIIDRVMNYKSLISLDEMIVVKTKLDDNNKYIENKLKSLRKIEFVGHLIGLLYAEKERTSLLAHMACRENPDIEFCAVVDMTAKTVGLRTMRDDINLTHIAKAFNGGGHNKASGFPIEVNVDVFECNLFG